MSDDQPQPPNVIKFKSKKSYKAKPELAYLFRELVDTVNRCSHTSNPEFPVGFYLYEPEPGKMCILEDVGNRVVRHVHKSRVINVVTQYTANELGTSAMFAWTPKTISQFVDYWMSLTEPIPQPLPFAEVSDRSLTFHRLNFDFKTMDGPTPIFDDFFGRCTNEAAIRTWIGSLFFKESNMFQYCWIYGEGGEGKGSVARALAKIMGPAHISMAVPTTPGQEQFFTYSLIGKRLIVFPECNKSAFPNGALFKQLTGGDHVWFERKNEMGFTGRSEAKFMFLSNVRTRVDGTSANLRRIIYGEVAPPTLQYSQYEYDTLMEAEASAFVSKCWRLYRDSCPNHTTIAASNKTLIELVDQNEEDVSVIASKYFLIDDNGFVTSARLQEIKGLEKMGDIQYSRLLEFMRRNYEARPAKKNHGAIRGWRGFRERNEAENATWVLEKNNPGGTGGDMVGGHGG